MKLDHYNINLNSKQPSSSDIEKHKDFDKLLQQFEDAPPPSDKQPGGIRWMYYLSGAVAACLLGFIAYNNFFNTNTGPELSTKDYLASMPYINPPFKNVQAAFVNSSIDGYKGGEYVYESGSKLVVPPSAFVDEQGQPVGGNINIRFREFHDYVDFFISGIPMEYDSAGTRYQLESAGMIEIYAEQDGKRLNVAPDKEIAVELVSEVAVPASRKGKTPSYNVYQLDVENRNWVYNGKDQVELLEEDLSSIINDGDESLYNEHQSEIAKIETKASKAIAQIEASIPKPSAPIRPKRAGQNAQVFNFEFNDNQIVYGNEVSEDAKQGVAEAQAQLNRMRQDYSNVMWQVAPNNPEFNKEAAAAIQWDDMTIRPINKTDYEVTLINGENTMKVLVNPVLTGEEYDKAMDTFNKEYQAYEAAVADRQVQLKAQKDALKASIAEERALATKSFEEQLATYRAKGQTYAATQTIIKQKLINRFRVSNLGIWNCDRPLPPFMARVRAEFVDHQENQYLHHTAYLVNKTTNTISRFSTSKGNDVVFDTSSDNILWLVTKQNKLAVFRPEAFKRINQDKDDYTFVLDVVNKAIQSEDDIRNILEF